MKWKLWWRQWSVSAPQMAVRSRRPWWVHAVIAVIVLAIALVGARLAYDAGRSLNGGDSTDRVSSLLAQANADLERTREERDNLQSAAMRASSDVDVANAARDRLATQLKTLEGENAKLRQELAFYERIAPSQNAGVAIRSFGVERESASEGRRFRYRLLVSQGAKPDRDFVGQVQIVVSMVRDGQGATMTLPDPDSDRRAFALSFRAFQRLEGVFEVPAGAVVQSVQVRVLEGSAVKAQQTAGVA